MTGSYGYISVIAMLCYCFMFLIFVSAKKNKLVNSFLLMQLAMLCWTAGSVFMRMELWPTYILWYHVSLFGILLLPYVYYGFVNSFVRKKEYIWGYLYLAVSMLLFVINIPSGLFLKYPEIIPSAQGDNFVYSSMDWKLCILLLPPTLLVIKMLLNIRKACKGDKQLRRQFQTIWIGIVVLLAGNILIMVPVFKGFPIDILCGMVNAVLLLFALVKRRLFRLQMLASERLGYGVGLVFTVLIFANLSFLNDQLMKIFTVDNVIVPLVLFAVCFVLVFLLIGQAWKVVVNRIVIRDEVLQAEKLKKFSQAIAKTLNLQEIMDKTIEVVKDMVDADDVYICVQKETDGDYDSVYCDKPLNHRSVSMRLDHPVVAWLKRNEEPLLWKEFKYTIDYRSMWEEEKYQLDRIGVQCCIAIREDEDMTGVMLLSRRKKKGIFGYNDVQVLSSVASVAGIALKNARLYEQAYKEARTDELTGLLNRKYFYEVLQEEFEKNREGSLVLAMFNVDDFKLFNQLYGVKEADDALRRIARIMTHSVGVNGYVARYSGKEFAVLLPRYDLLAARGLAKSISDQIYVMYEGEQDYKVKAITVSVGISAAPYAARTVKELIENVDMAVYHVKQRGKNGIQVFDSMFRNKALNQEDSLDHVHIYEGYQATIYALTAAIDAKDHYTFSHCNNVAYYATALAQALGYNDDLVEIIRQAALLHDIGKISIPEHVLNKQGKLTDEEYLIMQGHVEASIGIIRHLPSLDYVIPAVIGHHERYDGKGYPRRIAGESIPATARVLCIADSFDAITSKRVYKDAFSLNRAKNILREEAGRQFDPDMAQVFLQCLEDGRIQVVHGEYSGDMVG